MFLLFPLCLELSFYKKFWPAVGLFRSPDLLSFRFHYSFWEASCIFLEYICCSFSGEHLSVYGKVSMVIIFVFPAYGTTESIYVDIREEEGVSAR